MPRRQVSDSSSSNSSNSDSSEDSVKIVTVIVQNLSPNVSQEHISQIFSNFGHIHSCGLRRLKNYAIINYNTKEEAQTAIHCMHQGQIDGFQITVKYQEPHQEQENENKLTITQKKIEKNKPIYKPDRKKANEITRNKKDQQRERRLRERRERSRQRQREAEKEKRRSKKNKRSNKKRKQSSEESEQSSNSSNSSSSSSSNNSST